MFGQPRRASAAVYGAAAVLAVASAYVMLLARPGLAHSAAAFWRQLKFAQDAPSWALPAISAGVAIGCAAAGVALLSMFVRGVQDRPYVWLAPVLVGFSTLVLVGTPITLPWPSLSSEAFALLCGFALLGGGAVMQMHGASAKVAGGVLIALPAITLGAGYATLRAGFGVLPRFDPSAQLFLFVLGSTAFGVAFVALVTRRADTNPRSPLRDVGGEAFARAHAAEVRAAAAEHRALQLEHELMRRNADEAEDFRAMARPGFSAWVLSAIAAALIGGAAAGLYFGVYRPMASQLSAARAFVGNVRRDHAAEMAALRRRTDADMARLQAQLAAERQRVETAIAAAEQTAKDALARAATPAPAAEPLAAPASKTKVVARAKKPARAKVTARAKRAARTARPAVQRTTKAAATTAASDEPEFDRETRRALRDSVSDDPIEGL